MENIYMHEEKVKQEIKEFEETVAWAANEIRNKNKIEMAINQLPDLLKDVKHYVEYDYYDGEGEIEIDIFDDIDVNSIDWSIFKELKNIRTIIASTINATIIKGE